MSKYHIDNAERIIKKVKDWMCNNRVRFNTGAKRRREKDPERFKEYSRKHYKKHKDTILFKNEAYRIANKEKGRAQQKARRKYPTIDCLCEMCKERPATDRHHKDYGKPLNIQFLCRQCHINTRVQS